MRIKVVITVDLFSFFHSYLDFKKKADSFSFMAYKNKVGVECDLGSQYFVKNFRIFGIIISKANSRMMSFAIGIQYYLKCFKQCSYFNKDFVGNMIVFDYLLSKKVTFV
jgi:hypothetical protein